MSSWKLPFIKELFSAFAAAYCNSQKIIHLKYPGKQENLFSLLKEKTSWSLFESNSLCGASIKDEVLHTVFLPFFIFFLLTKINLQERTDEL
jgi:hypothetical protein